MKAGPSDCVSCKFAVIKLIPRMYLIFCNYIAQIFQIQLITESTVHILIMRQVTNEEGETEKTPACLPLLLGYS